MLASYIIWVDLHQEQKENKSFKQREYQKKLGKELVTSEVNTGKASASTSQDIVTMKRGKY